jgi:hypothetical protein
MIVAQQTAEPFTTPHGANGAASAVIIRSAQLLRRDHAIAQPLVRTEFVNACETAVTFNL